MGNNNFFLFGLTKFFEYFGAHQNIGIVSGLGMIRLPVTGRKIEYLFFGEQLFQIV